MVSKAFSKKNISIAWQTLRNGQNHSYKYYFKHLYRNYEIALEDNLNLLVAKLAGGSYKPTKPIRVFQPKSATSQRPITFLSIEDQIVYQAIAVYVSSKIRSRREKFEKRTVFSNILSDASEAFFFEDWFGSYLSFQEATEKKVSEGFHTVVTCDIASFYDTISHSILLRSIFGNNESQESLYLKQFLEAWSSDSTGYERSHGIPQGPIASDLLAEAFLLVLDKDIGKDLEYIRYVDDIRLFSKTYAHAQELSIRLEKSLRGLGLVPQTEKFSIKQLVDGTELNKLESSHPDDYDPDEDTLDLNLEETNAIFLEALNSENISDGKAPDKTKLRRVLFRGFPTQVITGECERLAKLYPQHIEGIFVYLNRAKEVTLKIKIASSLLESSPFAYVRFQCWTALHGVYPSLSFQSKKDLISKAIKAQGKEEASEAIGAGLFILRHSARTKSAHAKFVFSNKSPITLAIILKGLEPGNLPFDGWQLRRLVSKNPDTCLAVIERLEEQPSMLDYCAKNFNKLSKVAQNSLIALYELDELVSADALAESVESQFSIKFDNLPLLYGKKKAQVLRYLASANVYEKYIPGTWFRSINSFAELTVRSYFDTTKKIKKEGRPAFSHRNGRGKYLKYGQLLREHPFEKYLPEAAESFRTVNNKRNTDKDTHPIDEKTGKATKFVFKSKDIKPIRRLIKSGLEKILKDLAE